MSSTFPNFGFRSIPLHLSNRFFEMVNRLQADVDHTSPCSVYIYDLVDQYNIYSSCSLSELLGYTSDESNGMSTMGLAELIHPDDLLIVAEQFQRLAILPDGNVIEMAYRMWGADGRWHYLHSQETVFIKAIDGFPLQVIGVIRDITDCQTQFPSNSNLQSATVDARHNLQVS